MSQQKKLEKVLELLLNEDSDQAAELLHQIIVEKARVIYESIVEEETEEESVEEGREEEEESVEEAREEEEESIEESVEEEGDEVGGEPSKDFTKEISADKDEVESDEESGGVAGEEGEEDDGEAEGEEGGFGDEGGEESTEERLDDLESQLSELRAEFDALMGEEFEEPQHADLPGKMDDIGAEFGSGEEEEEGAMGGFGGDSEEAVVGEVVAHMFEKNKGKKLEKAPEAKDKKKDKKVEEETQFLKKVADTGQKGKAKMVGTGKDSPLGAENDKSAFTKPTSKLYLGSQDKDNIVSSKSTGGEYGKWNAQKGDDKTPSDNVDEKLKKVSKPEDKSEGKYVGTGKDTPRGATNTKAPLTKAPDKPMPKGNLK